DPSTNLAASCIEAFFLHRIKGRGARRIASFITRQRPVSPLPTSSPDCDVNYWQFIRAYIPHRLQMQLLQRPQHQRSEIGCCRAWVRACLNEGTTSSYLASVLQDRDRISRYYYANSLILDAERGPSSLNCLNLQSSLLNFWSSSAAPQLLLLPTESEQPPRGQADQRSFVHPGLTTCCSGIAATAARAQQSLTKPTPRRHFNAPKRRFSARRPFERESAARRAGRRPSPAWRLRISMISRERRYGNRQEQRQIAAAVPDEGGGPAVSAEAAEAESSNTELHSQQQQQQPHQLSHHRTSWAGVWSSSVDAGVAANAAVAATASDDLLIQDQLGYQDLLDLFPGVSQAGIRIVNLLSSVCLCRLDCSFGPWPDSAKQQQQQSQPDQLVPTSRSPPQLAEVAELRRQALVLWRYCQPVSSNRDISDQFRACLAAPGLYVRLSLSSAACMLGRPICAPCEPASCELDWPKLCYWLGVTVLDLRREDRPILLHELDQYAECVSLNCASVRHADCGGGASGARRCPRCPRCDTLLQRLAIDSLRFESFR
uniref:RUN domain-containing protein n=1 Tax=Macrostomum lignano TaxID=282301 RepID=A0A1I8F6L5_9PLAT